MNNFVSYNFAVAIVTLCVVAYYFGTLARRFIPESSAGQQAIDAVRFISIPLMLVTTVTMAMMLFTARQSFNAKQDLVNEIAGASLQLDRVLTYYGGSNALKAQDEFREYLQYLLKNPDAIWKLKDRSDVEPFARDIQALPIPPKDTGVAVATKKFALDLMGRISKDRFMLGTMNAKIIYPATYTLLAFWLCVVFSCMGATAPMFNPWVFWFNCIAAACVGSICFIVAEYQTSTAGFITLDASPFEMVLRETGEK
jgi:hypothetical protein